MMDNCPCFILMVFILPFIYICTHPKSAVVGWKSYNHKKHLVYGFYKEPDGQGGGFLVTIIKFLQCFITNT